MTEETVLPRTEEFEVEGPIELDVNVTLGRVEIVLGGSVARAEIRHDQTVREPWLDNMSNLLNWVGERFGGQFGAEAASSPVEAIRQTRVELVGNRFVVHGPKA